ncbi:MAG: hypothetical protein WBM72_15350 [Actinomycetota bacterium]
MLFASRLAPGIADGSVTLTFRRWKTRQAIVGHRYRTIAGMLEVDEVSTVEPGSITDVEARSAGYEEASALVADLRGDPSTPVTRVRFHLVDEPDPRDVLAGDGDLTAHDMETIDAKLARMDARSDHGPWTAATLAMIGARPGVRAADLAASMGRERLAFKADVRKLKTLGLTVSLEIGYRLSPRGRAYLAVVAGRDHGA